MLVQTLAAILDRDFRTLTREVEGYDSQDQLWQMVPGIPNPAGTLVLHLAGNLRHYIGATLGGTGYVRDRAAEFSRRDASRAELLAEIEGARSEVALTFAGLSDGSLPARFPDLVADHHIDTADYLVHLLTHFAYHLGQLDIHRRIVTGNVSGVGAVPAAELHSARPARS